MHLTETGARTWFRALILALPGAGVGITVPCVAGAGVQRAAFLGIGQDGIGRGAVLAGDVDACSWNKKDLLDLDKCQYNFRRNSYISCTLLRPPIRSRWRRQTAEEPGAVEETSSWESWASQ